MENYITKSELNTNKTYYKYVDCAVKLENGESLFLECLPSNKNARKEVLFQIVGMKKIKSVEILRTKYRLKEKWL